ncbi:fibronectin type III domain-containing protein [Plantactinospora sp. CA-294935]|uniref:fibronectin type III domain-containing protein n=1 Tax=Plantactinospora sp. CA-294935 TaxID=3240012 RepID=UPI003D91873B
MSVPVSTVADRHRPDRRPYAPIAAGLALVTTAALAAVLPSPVPVTAAIGGWQTLRLALRGDHLVGQFGTVPVTATDAQFASGRIGLATSYQGDQFYSQYLARVVPDNSPLTLQLAPTAAQTHFSVAARDSAGNTSGFSARASVRQPPTFPRSGDNTVPPSPPGTPVVTAVTPDGYLVTWEPATDDIGVVEYHVYHVFVVDEVRVDAKVSTNTAVIAPRGGYETVYLVAYDASWNASSSPSVRLLPPPTPPASR